jgi:hypothetical protein
MIGRGAGRSAVRAAAYRHSARMVCEHEGSTINYAGRQPIAHAELALPDDTPTRHRDSVAVYGSQEDFGTVEKMVASVGRQRLKEATTDYAKQEDYREAVSAFAERRGFDTLRTLKPFLDSIAQKARDVTATMRQSFEKLAKRFENVTKALRKKVPEQQVKQAGPQREPMFAPVTAFDKTVTEEARANAFQDKHVQRGRSEIEHAASLIYREPQKVVQSIEQHVMQNPSASSSASLQSEQFGELRGSTRLRDGFKARQEHKEAIAHGGMLERAVMQYAATFAKVYKGELTAEEQRRESMRVEVPNLSNSAVKALEDISQLDKQDALKYREAIDKLHTSQPKIADEITRFAKALNRRFGERAFSTIKSGHQQRVAANEKSRMKTHAVLMRTAQSVYNIRQDSLMRSQQAKAVISEGIERGVGK